MSCVFRGLLRGFFGKISRTFGTSAVNTTSFFAGIWLDFCTSDVAEEDKSTA